MDFGEFRQCYSEVPVRKRRRIQGNTGSDCFVTTGDRFDSLLGVWVRGVTESGSAVGRGK